MKAFITTFNVHWSDCAVGVSNDAFEFLLELYDAIITNSSILDGRALLDLFQTTYTEYTHHQGTGTDTGTATTQKIDTHFGITLHMDKDTKNVKDAIDKLLNLSDTDV